MEVAPPMHCLTGNLETIYFHLCIDCDIFLQLKYIGLSLMFTLFPTLQPFIYITGRLFTQTLTCHKHMYK